MAVSALLAGGAAAARRSSAATRRRTYATLTARKPALALAIAPQQIVAGDAGRDRTVAFAIPTQVGRRGCATSVTSSTCKKKAPVEKFRKDYTQPNYWIKEVQLDVRIFQGKTTVESMLFCELNDTVANPGAELALDGEGLTLESVELMPPGTLAGEVLEEGPTGYERTEEGLVVRGLGSATNFVLRTRVAVEPEKNTELSGLYFSGCMYCTQMEAEGFRRFTYFIDRPDVMSKYTRVRIEADRSKCPVLLGNGNQIEEGVCDNDDTRHFAVFQDPFVKPPYLFAIVAGDLGRIKDTFATASGNTVQLAVYSEKENVDQLGHAMLSLKKSMKWDEERFGLEYDLDTYNIVAVNDFNMGAMENKGLNIFNTSLTLAKPENTTDSEYERIEGVIGHEYFHNWTGNRVTCKDWFQLTLKEGLTVFRDQEFSGDMGSAAVKRIEEVRLLRAAQFREDGGPMAHPIRPESYIAMDNFYTATVYCKGAEVIRMYQTLLGREGFRKGMDLYFQRHDGSAVSCDDFRAAMADANERDFTQFEEWYLQPGTPQVEARSSWDEVSGVYKLIMKQAVGAGQKHLQAEKRREKPLHIPVVVGLIDRATGKEVGSSRVLELKEPEQTFDLGTFEAEPVPSILRDFSAPVKLDYPYTDEDLVFLAAYDTDSFNRWEAAQNLGAQAVKSRYSEADQEAPYQLSAGFERALKRILNDWETSDLSLLSYALILPAESTLMEAMPPPIDPLRLHEARSAVRRAVAVALKEDLKRCYTELSPASDEALIIDGHNAGKRRLRNTCLAYLTTAKDETTRKLCADQFYEARARGCMTDKLAAVQGLADAPESIEAQGALKDFYEDSKGDALVINKWFSIQAGADVEDILGRVQKLMEHPDFTMKNPNRLRSVVSVFAANIKGFHKVDGSGYAFLAKMVLDVDKLNPQVASRLALSFATWAKLDAHRQALVKEQLSVLRAKERELSKDTYEVITKLLSAA
eukprot:TRINITY_DN75405_c0_g1_i1.p1 TRINITY_DN75405_c0_g1~~TRINITY_DN75405_c0_g1_i1.p1  ORF type:complete len:1043 (+),score=184.92 TRINITY_DN75405_c0_g1_i1:199-3129(+)